MTERTIPVTPEYLRQLAGWVESDIEHLGAYIIKEKGVFPSTLRIAADQLASLKRSEDSLKASLWKYGKHLYTCRLLLVHSDCRCDCGWAEVRQTLAPEGSSNG